MGDSTEAKRRQRETLSQSLKSKVNKLKLLRKEKSRWAFGRLRRQGVGQLTAKKFEGWESNVPVTWGWGRARHFQVYVCCLLAFLRLKTSSLQVLITCRGWWRDDRRTRGYHCWEEVPRHSQPATADLCCWLEHRCHLGAQLPHPVRTASEKHPEPIQSDSEVKIMTLLLHHCLVTQEERMAADSPPVPGGSQLISLPPRCPAAGITQWKPGRTLVQSYKSEISLYHVAAANLLPSVHVCIHVYKYICMNHKWSIIINSLDTHCNYPACDEFIWY